jgi:hypothetical protein
MMISRFTVSGGIGVLAPLALKRPTYRPLRRKATTVAASKSVSESPNPIR